MTAITTLTITINTTIIMMIINDNDYDDDNDDDNDNDFYLSIKLLLNWVILFSSLALVCTLRFWIM